MRHSLHFPRAFPALNLFWHFVANSLGAADLMTSSCRISFQTLATAAERQGTARSGSRHLVSHLVDVNADADVAVWDFI